MVKTPPEGISERQAKRLLLENGENVISKGRKSPALKIFAGQFRDVMVLLLLAATAISAALGEPQEALAIAAIVLLNALLGFFQEWRCERTLEALSQMAAPAARVRREGAEKEIPASEVVEGDILIVSAGDCIAADAVILKQSALRCDESLLTGESLPVEKLAVSDFAAPSPAQKLFMGSYAVAGSAEAQVTATGMDTEMGKVAGLLDSAGQEQTPLQKRLDQVGKAIGLGCVIICAAVAGAGLLRGEPPLEMLITGVSLAVAAVPEGLPAIVTVSLALAVRRILRKNALVKRLHAVETLGCATVLCSDKTGTLTQNRMTVSKIATCYDDYDPKERLPDSDEGLGLLFCAAAFCNDSKPLPQGRGMGIFKRGDIAAFSGDPTETALSEAALAFGVRQGDFFRKGELPFDSERKRMTVWGTCSDGAERVYMKGAPEVVLKRCERIMTKNGIRPLEPALLREITRKNSGFAKGALRVLGFAFKDFGGDNESGLVFLGLIGLFDPPRPEAAAAVAKCRTAKIRVVMITGDNAETALAVARQLGLAGEGQRAVNGEQLDRLGEEQLCSLCKTANVFARVTPAHKLKIIRALKQNGEITAMTGDGVNDAPALKEAHIGVAMGESGADVTKEAADVILLDDNFATLVAAVEEGRTIYQNIKRFLRYLLSCNVGEVVTMLGGMLLGMPVLLTPIQLLLVNLVTDGLPAIALGLEPADDKVMKRPPRPPEQSIFAGGLPGKIAFRGLIIGLTTLFVFSHFYTGGASLAQSRTAALLTLILSQLFHVFECRGEGGLFGARLFSNPFLLLAAALSLAAALLAVYNPALSGIFMTVPLERGEMLKVCAAGAAAPVISTAARLFPKRSGRELQLT